MWSPADLVILVPMLGRAHRVDTLLASIHEATPTAAVLFVCSPEDVDVHDAIDLHNKPRITVPWRPTGDYARKINEGYRHSTEPLIFTGADDLHFRPGWFEAVTAKLAPGIGVVGTVDCCNKRTMRGEHSTHSLVTRDYADHFGTIDQPGEIMHEGYRHEYVDDELVGTARKRGAYVHAHDSVVEHRHPMAGYPSDAMYDQQGERMAESRLLYRHRRRRWA